MSGDAKKMWAAIFVLLINTACGSPAYIAKDIKGQVVDAETGQPIEGVNVMANWQLVQSTLDSDRMKGQLKIMETVTDEQGRFHFDGFIAFNWPNKFLRNSDPQVIFFKSGYEHERVNNDYPRAGTKTPGILRKAAVDGKVVTLKKINLREKALKSKGDLMFYTQFKIDIDEITTLAKECEWKKIPKFILAMDAEKKKIKDLYPLAYIGLVGIDDIRANPECGSPASFFEGINK